MAPLSEAALWDWSLEIGADPDYRFVVDNVPKGCPIDIVNHSLMGNPIFNAFEYVAQEPSDEKGFVRFLYWVPAVPHSDTWPSKSDSSHFNVKCRERGEKVGNKGRGVGQGKHAQNCMKCSKYEKSNSGRNSCIPRNLNYLSYEDQLGATLSFISIILSIMCAVILGIFRKYRETPIVRANNQYLSCLLLISLMLCFLSSLLFIGRPTQICCILQQVIFGIVFTISLSSLLAKTLTVIIAFNATKPGSKLKKYVGTQLSIILIIVCSLGETVISAVWLACNPPFAEADTLSDPDYIFLFCYEGSGILFFCIIGYMGTLALLSFIVAFLAKDFPDRFNEAKNITFSMLVFCSVWVTFVPAYLSSKGSRMVAVEIFAILSSSAGLLGCIFIPKCYIIFLRPELNTKDPIIRKC
ncbi:hypothetical protein XELAEV_18030272mg [Xenopus laevis]|uniref:G-protein coupled receptors family 3 profile domain-containing protein n=1 Tax=Xenopus laevis TaxID=8355 RepID=A0A974HIC9_XENLA|nr:hypothetical protein XELAEV_18030272mg [Xenopus laevis]